MAKMIIDLQKGLIEVEGDEKFIERVYSDFRASALDKLSTAKFDSGGQGDVRENGDETPPAKKARRRVKTTGPSCASRIRNLKDEGFFKAARSAGEVKEKLREKGTTYASKNVAAALNDVIKSGELRRFDEGGWQYQNP